MKKNMSSKHECKHCFQCFESRTQVAKHMYLHKQGHICSQCNKPFASESGLKRHVNANHTHNRTTFKCTICDLSFRLKRDFEKHHLSKHRADKHFECKQCGVRFSWLINLAKHEKFHSEQKDTKECMNESFTELVKDESSVIKLYQCEICGKKFNYDFTYAIHLAGHEKSKSLANEDSHNITTEDSILAENSAEGLEDEVNESEGDKNAELAPSGKESEKVVMNYIPSEEENKDLFEYLNDCRSRREGKMKRKRKDEVIYDFVMTENKPYKCNQCGEAFRWQVSLDIHLKVHSGDKTLKVRKPYLSSKMLIAEKKKKKDVGKVEKESSKEGGSHNESKIIYQNESDEDNDIYEYEEEENKEEEKEGKVKCLSAEALEAGVDARNSKQEGPLKTTDTFVAGANQNNGSDDVDTNGDNDAHGNIGDNDVNDDDEAGMNAIDLLNSIGKPQTLNDHDYL